MCVSIAVLTIGLVAAAAMFGKVWGSTAYSEYMIQASTLVSEKLEDLNRYPNGDPNVAVPMARLQAAFRDLDASVTSNGVTETVDYFDEVFFSAASGSVSETQSRLEHRPITLYDHHTQSERFDRTGHRQYIPPRPLHPV